MYSFNRIKSVTSENANINNDQPVNISTIQSFNPQCIRQRTNWSQPESRFRFEHSSFNMEEMKTAIETYSPKLHTLLEHIRQLDAEDLRQGNYLQKHFIFTNLQSSDYGAKMIASGFLANGYKMGYGRESNGDLRYKSLNQLEETAYNNFFMLTSTPLFDKPMKVKDKQKMLQLFNARPEHSLSLWETEDQSVNNVYGKYIRFVILDSEFKEGIDLLDIKYVHLFEPATSTADQTQIIGRATRAYGQCGLHFTPNVGWPLQVYIYDMEIPLKLQSTFLDSKSLFTLYQKLVLKKSGIDINLSVLARQIQNLSIYGAVDYELTENLHRFQGSVLEEEEEHSISSRRKTLKTNSMTKSTSKSGGMLSYDKLPIKHISFKNKKSLSPLSITPMPTFQRSISFQSIRRLVRNQFASFAWTDADLNARCQNEPAIRPHLSSTSSTSTSVSKSISGGGDCENKLITLNPTQRFIPAYFVPENPVKGMLLWHGTGTGKTCIAVATATSAFEREGYTILWVTRASLKSDFYKNIFDQSCHEGLRAQIAECDLDMPDSMSDRLKLLSDSWRIPPLSYKQFTNLIAKKNEFYERLVKINGPEDPLRKTLLIIDEAHKLFSENDLIQQEMPNIQELTKAIQHSYVYSGKDSIRLLLMTATPIGQKVMEIVQLVNLCNTEQMPETYDEFAEEYLEDSTGLFTPRGQRKYLNNIAGKISYLNREKDIYLFSQPVVEKIKVPLPSPMDLPPLEKKAELMAKQNQSTKQNDKLIHQLKTIVQHVQKYDAAFFQKKLKGCADFQELPRRETCEKIVATHIQEIINVVRPIFAQYRLLLDRSVYDKKTLLENHELELKQWEERKQEHQKQKELFSKSLYSMLIQKCGIQEADDSQQGHLQNNPKLMRLQESLQILKEEQSQLEDKLSVVERNHEKRIRMLETLPENERKTLWTNKAFRQLWKEEKETIVYLQGLLKQVETNKRNFAKEKKEYLQKIRIQWKDKVKAAFEGQKKSKRRRRNLGGRKTMKRILPKDSLPLHRIRWKNNYGRKRGGGEKEDIKILLEKLTNQRIEKTLAEIDQFVKKLVRIHVISINKSLQKV